MALKVIGAGLGRTGTLSLKLALEALGVGRCYHMREVLAGSGAATQWLRLAQGERVSWDAVFAGFSATVDYPSALFYEALARRYPRAKVILTERDPDQWFDSTQRTIFNEDLDRILANPTDDWGRMVARLIVPQFDGRLHDRAHAITVFRAHNARVKQVIPPERLLVYQVGEGWEPLCRFLGAPQPAAPFPQANTSEQFGQTAAHRLRGKIAP